MTMKFRRILIVGTLAGLAMGLALLVAGARPRRDRRFSVQN